MFKTNTILLWTCMLFTPASYAQLNRTTGNPYFFGVNPNAAAEAMGGAFAAAPGNVSSAFYNPAGIVDMKGVEAAVSIANRYGPGVVPAAAYFMGAAGVKWNRYLSTAFTWHAAGYSMISTYMKSTDKMPLQKYTLTIGSTLLRALDVGLNISRFEVNEYQKLSSFCLDAGAKYRQRAGRNSNVFYAANITNFTFATMQYTEPFTPGNIVEIPTYATAAMAYQNTNLFNKGIVMLNQLEFKFDCQGRQTGTLRLGTELVFWKRIALRGGYYSMRPSPAPYQTIRAFTYGVGLILKMDDFNYFKESNNEWQIDFCNLPIQSDHASLAPGNRYTIFNIVLRHRLQNKCLTCPDPTRKAHYAVPNSAL